MPKRRCCKPFHKRTSPQSCTPFQRLFNAPVAFVPKKGRVQFPLSRRHMRSCAAPDPLLRSRIWLYPHSSTLDQTGLSLPRTLSLLLIVYISLLLSFRNERSKGRLLVPILRLHLGCPTHTDLEWGREKPSVISCVLPLSLLIGIRILYTHDSDCLPCRVLVRCSGAFETLHHDMPYHFLGWLA